MTGTTYDPPAGNWRSFDSFAWTRAGDVPDPDNWAIFNTLVNGAGLVAQSNASVINATLEPFTEGDNPDVVFERHDHWLFRSVECFSVRVWRRSKPTKAFKAWCELCDRLNDYPLLDEQDYSRREYEATLANYREAMFRRKDLPEGWEAKVYTWFCDNGPDHCITNHDDHGGWAQPTEISLALAALGLLPKETKP